MSVLYRHILVKSPASNSHPRPMKNLTGGPLLKVFKDDSTLAEKQSGETTDIWEIATRSNNDRSLKEKNINVVNLFRKAKTNKKLALPSRNENCSQVFSQSSQHKPLQKSFSIADIVSKSKSKHKQQNRVTKPPRIFEDHNSNFSTPLVSQLKQSVSNINHTIRVSKLKKQFDILFRIKSIKKLSNNELLVIPSISNTELKYILHIEGNKSINDEMFSYRDKDWKVATYSKAIIKLSTNVYWCLLWEFIK